MNQTKYIFLIFLLVASFSCSKTETVINPKDYEAYLQNTEDKKEVTRQLDVAFWKQKLHKTPDQFIYKAKLATIYTQSFLSMGDIDKLKEAETLLLEVNANTNYTSAGYMRDLARNYISQHRFKEALQLLKKAEKNGEKLAQTQLMLVDVYIELGNKKMAGYYLDKVKNFQSFEYLIRLSKYNDFLGDLDNAIVYLEKALAIATTTKNNELIEWNYTNLADYYGHAGRIKDAYNFYLKALAINPNNHYALKGIAWVAFSNDKNIEAATTIVDALLKKSNHPDYYLFKAEIAEYLGDKTLKENQLQVYQGLTSHPYYGDMYAKYNILVSIDKNDIDTAITLAHHEIKNRPTAQSYALLAYAQFKNNQLQEAKQIIETKVLNQTFEPELLLYAAEVLKASNQDKKVKQIKEELLASTYELGPVTTQKVTEL